MKFVASFVSAVVALMVVVAPAHALSKYSTIESVVVIDNPMAPLNQQVIKIVGPDQIEYRVQAPLSEVERLTLLLKNNPHTVVRFNGEVIDENGNRMFKVKDWTKTETTTTKTTTDAMGNKAVESQTETHTDGTR